MKTLLLLSMLFAGCNRHAPSQGEGPKDEDTSHGVVEGALKEYPVAQPDMLPAEETILSGLKIDQSGCLSFNSYYLDYENHIWLRRDATVHPMPCVESALLVWLRDDGFHVLVNGKLDPAREAPERLRDMGFFRVVGISRGR